MRVYIRRQHTGNPRDIHEHSAPKRHSAFVSCDPIPTGEWGAEAVEEAPLRRPGSRGARGVPRLRRGPGTSHAPRSVCVVVCCVCVDISCFWDFLPPFWGIAIVTRVRWFLTPSQNQSLNDPRDGLSPFAPPTLPRSCAWHCVSVNVLFLGFITPNVGNVIAVGIWWKVLPHKKGQKLNGSM